MEAYADKAKSHVDRSGMLWNFIIIVLPPVYQYTDIINIKHQYDWLSRICHPYGRAPCYIGRYHYVYVSPAKPVLAGVYGSHGPISAG